MKAQLSSVVKLVIGWPLTVLAFLFIGKIIYDQAPQIVPHLHEINPLLLFYGIVSLFFYYALRSIIWQKILEYFGYHVPFKESNYLWAVSELKRYIPGKVWTFLGRAVVFHKKGVEKKDVVRGMLIEVELFVVGSVIVSLLALPYLVSGYNSTIGWFAVILVSLGAAFYIFAHHVLQSRIQKQSTPSTTSRGLLHFARNDVAKAVFPPFKPQETILLIVISAVATFFFGLGNYLVISSLFYLELQQLPQLIGLFVFAFVAGFLSFITPAGFGVREGILIVGLNRLIGSGAGAFAALYSRILLVLTEVLYIGLSFLWLKLRFPALLRVEKWIASHLPETVVICLSIIYTIYIGTISMLRYNQFYAGRFDLGNMAQTVWNTSNGNFFMLTNPNATQEVSRLAFHADFILIFFAPFYWIWPDPRVLLLIQAVVVAAGAYFIYLLTQKILNSKLLGVVLAFAYLINPSVQRVNIYDFHAPALATTFLLATFYFYLKKQYLWFLLFALLAAFCKEQIWAIIAVFGIFLMVHHKKWILGSAVFFISAGMFYYLISYAIPAQLGDAHFALEYYSGFGSSPAEIIRTIILSPDKLVAIIMEEEHLKYLKQLFSPLGYLSYLAPWFLIFAAPDLLINLLSSNSQLHQIYYQYTAAITPFIFIAAIYGIWVLKKIADSQYVSSFLGKQESRISSGSRFKPVMTIGWVGMTILVVYILYHALHTAYLYGPMPGSKEPNLHMMIKPEKNKELIDRTIAAIPIEARVAASNNLGSHFSNRRHIYVLPVGAEKADYIVFLLTDSEKGSSFPPQVDLREKLRTDPRYVKVVEKDEFVVFKRK